MNNSSDYGWRQEMPSSLHDKLRADLKKAMLNKDLEVRDTIRLIMAEFPKLTVPITLESGKKTTRLKKPEEISNDDVIGIIKGLAKSERTVLEATRQESSEYLTILQSYLPKTIAREEIIAWIQDNIDFSQYKRTNYKTSSNCFCFLFNYSCGKPWNKETRIRDWSFNILHDRIAA